MPSAPPPISTDTTSDAELLRSGSRAAFHVLYRRHARAVLRYAWRLTDDSADAEDLVQEVFATAWAKRRSIDIPGESALPWLLVTCRNHGANLVRHKARTRTVALDDESTDAVAAPGDLAWLHDEIAALSPVDQQICRLCLMDRVPYAAVATQLGISPNGVAKRVERIRKHLRAARATN